MFAAGDLIEVQGAGISDPWLRPQNGDGKRHESYASENERAFEQGKGKGAVLGDAGVAGVEVLPCDAACSEEDGINGDQIIVLRVQRHHACEQEDKHKPKPTVVA